MEYTSPTIVDYGSVSDHTFQTPGKGTKSSNTTFVQDKYGEYSHPAGTS